MVFKGNWARRWCLPSRYFLSVSASHIRFRHDPYVYTMTRKDSSGGHDMVWRSITYINGIKGNHGSISSHKIACHYRGACNSLATYIIPACLGVLVSHCLPTSCWAHGIIPCIPRAIYVRNLGYLKRQYASLCSRHFIWYHVSRTNEQVG